MNDAQRYLVMGLPSIIAMLEILVNMCYFVAVNGRMHRVEGKLDSFTGKVTEIDNRVIRIQDKLGIV